MSLFDRFADRTERTVSRPAFFTFCVLLVVIWAPTIAFLKMDTWQLIINTLTTIITFLLLALMTNTSRRSTERIEKMLRRICEELGIEPEDG